jgi:hypothetical protein
MWKREGGAPSWWNGSGGDREEDEEDVKEVKK